MTRTISTPTNPKTVASRNRAGINSAARKHKNNGINKIPSLQGQTTAMPSLASCRPRKNKHVEIKNANSETGQTTYFPSRSCLPK